MSPFLGVQNSDRTSQESDEALMSRLASGDQEAFAAFYDRHATMLYSLAIRILQNETEAQEVLQEASVQLWERSPTYRPALGKPLSWALAVVRNRAIDRLRANQRRTKLLADSLAEGPALEGGPPEPTSRLEQEEAAASVNEALRALPDAQQQAIELAYFRGMSQTEIAAFLGEPLGTIKARMRRGMIQMRDALEGTL